MLRFWNGERWTEHRTPMQRAPQPPSDPQGSPKPGWYPDSQRPGWSRFWNGNAWEKDYRQTALAPKAPGERWSLAKVFLIWWGIATAALAVWSFGDILEAPALIAGDLLVMNLFASALLGAAASGVVTVIWAVVNRRSRGPQG